MKKCLILLISIGLFSGCNQSTPTIEGFENYVWKRDKFGCGNERQKMVRSLLNAREKIIGLTEAEVIQLLGKADEQEIYSRNQKFLIYFLEPNIKCTAPTDVKTTADALHIRINAIGVANELYVSSR